ncbi:MAG: pyridoxal-phosphate dependent enzyme [Candidatus Nanoarchaeia archaeon]
MSDFVIVQEKEFPKVMSWELLEKWADNIPVFDKRDALNPEWRPTSEIYADLTSQGYGAVWIKNEADKKSNPTGTIKDRMAWEIVGMFRDFARKVFLKKSYGGINGNVSSLKIPRLSYLTAGNVGRAVPTAFEHYGLPPMKLLVDKDISQNNLESIKKLHADIYLTDLNNKSLSPEDIKRMTNNEQGADITSLMAFEPQSIFYDWHVHEAFNFKPDNIFMPYGSGRLFENYMTWQIRNLGAKDPRMQISQSELLNISLLAAQPEQEHSIADKLATKFNPFVIYADNDIRAVKNFQATGKNTGIYKISEEYLGAAYLLLSKFCDCEPSAAAGLALYMKLVDEKRLNKSDRTLIINTGKGLC